MGRLLALIKDTWRSWSVQRRAITAGVVVIAAAGLGVLAYELLKRPPDVSNSNVDFAGREQKEPKQKRPKDTTFDWPTYGFNDQRTRYVPSDVVKPPFDSSDWSFQAGKLLEFSPIIVGDRIYFMDIDARFYALDTKRGKVVWKERVGELNASAPAYSRRGLFGVNLEPGQAFALRPHSGNVLWRTPLPGRSESSPLAFKDKLVIFGCECGTVLALDQKDGSIEWTVETGGAIKGALAQGNGNVYGGNYAGEFFSIDAETGKVEWRINTIGGSFGRGGGVYSTPAVAFGRVYFGSIDSRVYSLDMDTGEIAWSKSTGAEVYSGPAIADTKGTRPTVYIGSIDNNFYALDAKTGATRWQQPAGGQVSGAPSVIGDVVYVSVIGDVGTIGYDVENGKKVYEHELGEYNPAITDGERLYLTGYSELRAFAPEDGKKQGSKRKQGGKKNKGDGGKRKRAGGKKNGDGATA
jgi:outer membrane protein assembly factor BamB